MLGDNNSHDEEGASEVTEECENPVLKHLENAGAAMKGGHRRKLCNESITRTQKA